jgi:hypothetical protein
MKRFIFISALFEVIAGLVLFLAPDQVPTFTDNSPIAIGLARMYGGAAFSIGLYLILVWRSDADVSNLKRVMIFLLSFNVLIAVAIFVSADQGGITDIKPGIVHALLGMIALYFLWQNRSVE